MVKVTSPRQYLHTVRRCDIDSIESLADAVGLTVGEVEQALYGRPSVRRRCCARMLMACIDAAVLARCTGAVCRVLDRFSRAVA